MKKQLIAPLFLVFASNLYAAEATVTLYKTSNDQQSIGTVQFKDTDHGLLITPALSDLKPGLHGFHLHEKGDCGDQGLAAGGHYDPEKTGTHQGPYGKGHLGDLPVLYVGQDNKASTPTLAPRLKVSDLKGLALMVHEGGDNYSDNPKLGGGGDRIACGVIGKDKTEEPSKK